MIRQAESLEMLRRYVKQDLFSVRICALARAYGFTYSFVSFYVQLSGDRVTALLSDLEGDLTISALEDADRVELAAFVAVRAHRSVLTDCTFSLPGRVQNGAVMLRAAAADCAPSGLGKDVPLQTPGLTELFAFMEYDGQSFEAWYADLNHRIRHGCAQVFSIEENGQIVSAAVLAFIDGNTAVLTSVRTHPSVRGRGFGSRLVADICRAFGGQVYLMCENSSIVSFYERLGFHKTENWRMCL